MRTMINVILSLGFVVILSLPGLALAEDDNGNDGKGYPGSLCSARLGSSTGHRKDYEYVNTSGSSQEVTCPIIQDSWMSTSGLAYARMQVKNNNGGSITCELNSMSITGGFVSTISKTTSSAGNQTIYFWNGSSYLPSTASEGYMFIFCTLGPNDTIVSYTIQEKH